MEGTWEEQKSPIEASLTSVAFDKAGRIWSRRRATAGEPEWRRTVDRRRSGQAFLGKVFRVGDELWRWANRSC